MNVIEFIGFIVSLIAMVILFFSRMIEKRRQKRNPKLYDEMTRRKEESLREFMQALDIRDDRGGDDVFDEEDEEDEETLPPRRPAASLSPPAIDYLTARPQQQIESKYQFSSSIDQRHFESSIEKRQLNPDIKDSYKNRFISQIEKEGDQDGEASDPYAIKQSRSKARALKLVDKLESPQEMVVLREIIGPPKAFFE